MRGLFSFIGLLIVVAILALVARSQLHSAATVPPADGAGLPASAASGSFAQRASAIPQQLNTGLNQLMQQRPSQVDGVSP